MNKKILYLFILGLILYLSFCSSVFAKENILEVNSSLYSSALENFPLTKNMYDKLDTMLMTYIEENLDVNKVYILVLNTSRTQLNLITNPIDFSSSTIFKRSNHSFFMIDRCQPVVYFNYKLTTDDITFGSFTTSEYCGISDSISSNFYGSYPLIWSNQSLKYDGDLLDDYYSYHFNVIDNRSYDKPIYTYTNLLFGTYKELIKEKTSYRIEYYFDDLIDVSKTEYLSGYVGDKIEYSKDYSSDLYKFFSKEIVELTNDVETNVLKVYYRSPLYNTDKQPINIERTKIHFFYTFSDIKSMFSNITFENFTQYEQFVIVLLFNIFYCLFLFFVSYFLLRAIFKVWEWIKLWIF